MRKQKKIARKEKGMMFMEFKDLPREFLELRSIE
jgi:hypothetical protein